MADRSSKSAAALVLPDAVRQRVAAQGRVAAAWLEALPATLERLARQWQFEPGEVLAGGSEALVLSVVLPAGEPAVVKIGVTGECDCVHEAEVLRCAAGRGYVTLFDVDEAANALLLERLGGSLGEAGLPTAERLTRLAGVLAETWVSIDVASSFTVMLTTPMPCSRVISRR